MPDTQKHWSIGRLSTEWLSANLSRAYPLADSTGGVPGTLPSTLLSDALVLVTGIGSNSSLDNCYIYSIKNTGKSIILDLAVVVSGKEVIFNNAAEITFESDDLHTAAFSGDSEDIAISGSITAGLIATARSMPTNTKYTPSQSSLFAGIVRDVTAHTANNNCVDSVTIGGITLTGDVVIDLGDGVGVEDLGNNCVRIFVEDYAVPEENNVIISDAELLSELISKYGTPIRTINSVPPDSSGNFIIVSGDSFEADTIDRYKYAHILADSGDGPGTIRLRLELDPCLELEDVRRLTTNIEKLNDRSAHLDSVQVSLDNAIGSVATQLTRLG